MSLRDISMFFVLGEDDAHCSFIRAWLDANGVHHRQIHVELRPVGTGGIHFVLAKCADVLRAARARANRAQTRAIFVIDADDDAVEAREVVIARALDAVGEHAPELSCVLVPKRHIETWVHALDPAESPPNENDGYKPKTISQVRSAAKRLAQLSSPPEGPPSLVRGYEALRRLRDT